MSEWWLRRRERLDGLSDLLLYADSAAVLDLGCHRGLVSYQFARHGATLVHGCDKDEGNIVVARRLFEDVASCEKQFEVIDLSHGIGSLAPFGAQQYDIILMMGLYHKLQRQMTADALAEFIRALSDRTRLFFAWVGDQPAEEAIGQSLKMKLVHHSKLTGHPTATTAVWQR